MQRVLQTTLATRKRSLLVKNQMRVLKPVCEEDAAAEENVRLTRSESLSRLMASESSRRGHRRSRRLMEAESSRIGHRGGAADGFGVA